MFRLRPGLRLQSPDQVWNGAPEAERAQDPQRRGVPIVVDLQRVVAEGMRPKQNFVMVR